MDIYTIANQLKFEHKTYDTSRTPIFISQKFSPEAYTWLRSDI